MQTIDGFQVRNAEAAQAVRADVRGDQRSDAAGSRPGDLRSRGHAASRSRSRPYTPAAGAEYPRGRFGQSLQQIAQLIKSDVGVEMAFADIGGWDHHVNELGPRPSEGVLANLLREFGQSLARFLEGHGRPHERCGGGHA